jgi:hypothetical protein
VAASWLPAGCSGPIVDTEPGTDAHALVVGIGDAVLRRPCVAVDVFLHRSWLELCAEAWTRHHAATGGQQQPVASEPLKPYDLGPDPRRGS